MTRGKAAESLENETLRYPALRQPASTYRIVWDCYRAHTYKPMYAPPAT
jgi:hypothetical protein